VREYLLERLGLVELLKSNQENTYLGSTVSAVESVTIIDPRHPLFGRTLPLVHITNKQYQGRCCVVLLQEGIERIVPLKATDHSSEPIQEFPLPIDLSSVKQLYEVFRRILRIHHIYLCSVKTPMEEAEDGDIQATHIFSEGDDYSNRVATTTPQGDLGIAQQRTATGALSHGSSSMPQHRINNPGAKGDGT